MGACMKKKRGSMLAAGKGGKGKKGKKWDFRKTPKKGKQKVRRAIKFNGDYDKVVGAKKEKFLQECTAKAPEDVICSDVRKGSIIIDYQGPADKVEEDVAAVQAAGALELP